MPLRDQVVDIFLTGPDQLPSSHQGGVGRLTEVRNGTFEHFDPSTVTAAQSKAQFLNLKQRKGMRSLALTGHSAANAAATTPSWSGPRLLTTTGAGAPLGVYRSKPRVYDGTDWTTYETSRVVTNKTTARPVYSAQSVAQAPDTSWLGGVQCRVWTEVTQASNISSTSVTAVVAGFRADNGAWIRTPFVVQAGGAAGLRTMARVVNDGTNFWVFATDHNGGSPKINMFVYDTNGKQLATSTSLALNWTVYEPGYWDVQRRPATSTIIVAQPNGTDPDADNHVKFTQCVYGTGTITLASNVDASIHCNGPIAFLTNFQDSLNYIATTNFDTGDTVRLWGYQITWEIDNTIVQTHIYDYGVTLATTPDTLIGFTEASTDSTPAHKNLVISAGIPAIASIYGAALDPALRYIKSWRDTWAGVTTFIRQTNSLCQVSRAFVIDDDYYAWTYYQSGSGEAEPELVSIEIQAGDLFIGSPEQPIEVQSGDYVRGSPQLFAGTSVFTTNAQVAGNIIAGDTVINTVVPPGLAAPPGTAALQWTLTNSTGGAFTVGSRLDINGNTDYPAINTGQWLIIAMGGAGPSHVFYTVPTSTAGGTVPDIIFTTSGTSTVVSMTKYNMDVASIYDGGTARSWLENGTMVVTGSAVGANNGTKTIDNAVIDGIWIVTGSEGTSATGFSATLTPGFVNDWFFANRSFDDSLIDSTLRSGNDTKPANVGDFPITDAPSSHLIETGGETTLVPQVFTPTLDNATASIVLNPTQTPYMFVLGAATFDYSYIGAIISWTGPQNDENAGLYKITQVLTSHKVATVPVSTVGAPRSELILDPPSFITILKAASTFPQVQPQWFITPLGDVTTPQVGNLELGLAYADWRREGAVSTVGAQNPYLLHVSTPCLDLDGYTTTLPFRAVTVTEQSPTVIGGNVSTSAITAAVIGVKEFKLYSATFGTANDGIIPGPLAAAYDGGSFVEAGILIGPDQPTLQTQAEASNPALKKGAIYSYVACWEAIDGTGNRIWTAPSPALEVSMFEDNTSVTISGRLPIPLGSSGSSLASTKHYGLSNRPMIVLSLYRTCIQNGLQTTAHYKITDDLAPNATTPISGSNDSGFAFPDEFTWTYKDENLDSVVLANEKLYTDRGLLPRFHPPAFHNGATGWQERDWLNAYDGAIWFSGEGAEGEASWYTPLFRVPAPFEPTAIGNLESFLAGFALDSKWYLPGFKPPLNNGQLLSDIPAWQRLPLEGGCTGVVLPIRGGLAYSSNFGGVWFLSRALQDEWTSRDMIDSLDGKTISSMAVDAKQRLHVLTNSNDWFCYDQIARRWSRWIINDPFGPRLATVSNGVVYWASTTCVAFYDSTLARDIIAGTETGTPLGFTLASLNFANVSGIKKLRLIQLRGTYKGTHKVAMSVSYPDQNSLAPTTTMQLFTPDPAKPYVLDAYPKTEEASSYGVVVDADFTGVATPGDSFELDVVGALVAVSGKAGTNRSTQQISNG